MKQHVLNRWSHSHYQSFGVEIQFLSYNDTEPLSGGQSETRSCDHQGAQWKWLSTGAPQSKQWVKGKGEKCLMQTIQLNKNE